MEKKAFTRAAQKKKSCGSKSCNDPTGFDITVNQFFSVKKNEKSEDSPKFSETTDFDSEDFSWAEMNLILEKIGICKISLNQGQVNVDSLSGAFCKIVNLYIGKCKKVEELERKIEAVMAEKRRIRLDYELEKGKSGGKFETDWKKIGEIGTPRNAMHSAQAVFSHFMRREAENKPDDQSIMNLIRHFNDKAKANEYSLNMILKELAAETVSKGLVQISYLNAFKANYQAVFMALKEIHTKLLPKHSENHEIAAEILKKLGKITAAHKAAKLFRKKICEAIQKSPDSADELLLYEIEAISLFRKLFSVDKNEKIHKIIHEVFIFVHDIKNFLEVIST